MPGRRTSIVLLACCMKYDPGYHSSYLQTDKQGKGGAEGVEGRGHSIDEQSIHS